VSKLLNAGLCERLVAFALDSKKIVRTKDLEKWPSIDLQVAWVLHCPDPCLTKGVPQIGSFYPNEHTATRSSSIEVI
jgi:hypothetical protein